MHCDPCVVIFVVFDFLQLVEKLLISAVTDADVTVRHSIFTSVHGDRGFDEYLAQADNLSAVFAALNDEVELDRIPCLVRCHAIWPSGFDWLLFDLPLCSTSQFLTFHLLYKGGN
jgi:hypothetical protein